MITINRQYDYNKLERVEDEKGNRLYQTPTGAHPSVTTILDATDDNQALKEWRERVGEKKAQQVKEEATGLGTLMHEHLESYIQSIPRPGGSNIVRKLASNMADQIINRGLCNVDEVWGFEEPLWFPNLYAGTTDLIAVYNGQPSICDYKTTNKMKTRDKLDSYFCQGAAYALAHNELYGTDIKQIVIFMVSRDLQYETFIVERDEFDKWADKFVERLNKYYEMMANGEIPSK